MKLKITPFKAGDTTQSVLNRVHFSSKTDDWSTPQATFDQLSAKYGPFDLDVCATSDNYKVASYLTPEDNALTYSWAALGSKCWMNPPYGRGIGAWVKKAYEEAQRGCLVVCLLPARTDTRWFHDYCMLGEVEFLRGRLKFGRATNSAPFPSMVVVFRPKGEP